MIGWWNPFTLPLHLVQRSAAGSCTLGVKLARGITIGLLGLFFATCFASGHVFASDDGGQKSSGASKESHESSSKESSSKESASKESSSKESESKDAKQNEVRKPSAVAAPNPTIPLTPKAQSSLQPDALLAQRLAITQSPVLNVDAAKQAITDGKAVSMTLLLTFLNQNHSGQVLDVKLHESPIGLTYEVKLLSNIVVLRSVFLDAATLKPM